MPLLTNGITLANAVLADGQPRPADADDGTRHMLFKDGSVVRSCLLAEWDAEQAALAARDQERAKKEQTRQSLHAALTPIRGKSSAQWSVAEMRDLLAILLDDAGMLDADGVVDDSARP